MELIILIDDNCYLRRVHSTNVNIPQKVYGF